MATGAIYQKHSYHPGMAYTGQTGEKILETLEGGNTNPCGDGSKNVTETSSGILAHKHPTHAQLDISLPPPGTKNHQYNYTTGIHANSE